jgi:hypothetical protein
MLPVLPSVTVALIISPGTSPSLPTISDPSFNHLLKTLNQVLEYCDHHKADPLPSTNELMDTAEETRRRTTDISEWDQKFIQVGNGHHRFASTETLSLTLSLVTLG